MSFFDKFAKSAGINFDSDFDLAGMKFNDASRTFIVARPDKSWEDEDGYVTYRYDEIENFEILEEVKTPSAVERLVTNGVLLGAIGGASAVMSRPKRCGVINVKIYLSDNAPLYYEMLREAAEAERGSTVYENAMNRANDLINQLQKAMDLVGKKRSEIASDSQEPKRHDPAPSPLDEIKKLKELLDIGAITQEEFEAKKKQLLGL